MAWQVFFPARIGGFVRMVSKWSEMAVNASLSTNVACEETGERDAPRRVQGGKEQSDRSRAAPDVEDALPQGQGDGGL